MVVKSVDTSTLQHWLAKDEVELIDVREPAEHAAENIEGATLVPLSKVSKHSIPNVVGKKLVIHCRSGGRSLRACQKLYGEDPSLEVYNLEGGISAWAAAGNSVNSSGRFFLGVDRQVQLTIGLCVLAGSLLGFFVDPLFFLLSGFFGAGLTIAGLTGFCGLALLMAKMPWNQKCESGVLSKAQ